MKTRFVYRQVISSAMLFILTVRHRATAYRPRYAYAMHMRRAVKILPDSTWVLDEVFGNFGHVPCRLLQQVSIMLLSYSRSRIYTTQNHVVISHIVDSRGYIYWFTAKWPLFS